MNSSAAAHPARAGSWPPRPALGTCGTHLGDLRVGALDVVAGPVKPGAGGADAVLLEGAPALAAAPATLELPVGLQAEAAALPLRRTLVEMDCKERGRHSGIGEGSSRPHLFLEAWRKPSPAWVTPMIAIILARITDGGQILN